MYIVHVFVEVKPDRIEDFIEATRQNARESINEPGISRFDILQDQDSPAQFVMVEVYRTPEDPARHKETAHYNQWKDTVADMMAIPRIKRVFDNIYPDDEAWD